MNKVLYQLTARQEDTRAALAGGVPYRVVRGYELSLLRMTEQGFLTI